MKTVDRVMMRIHVYPAGIYIALSWCNSSSNSRTGRRPPYEFAQAFPQERTKFHAILLPRPSPCRKDAAMEPIISDLLTRFEKGTLTRRQLVSGLAMLAASGTGASAQQELD